MANVPDHLKQLFQRLKTLPVGLPPSPWRHVADHAIGGLTDVAFADSSDLLLVVSSVGRGLFDCASGERIARDPSTDFEHDTCNLLVPGIGSLAEQKLRTAGLHGGGLALTTCDGWTLDGFALEWPMMSLFLTPPGHWIYGLAYGRPGDTSKVAVDSELRAFGFSPTGRSFVFAMGSDVSVFNRAA